MTQQLVDKYRAGRVFGGGLKIKTTIDPEIQARPRTAVAGRLAGVGPNASLVAIENKTGEVKAMVGGSDFDSRPFNLATNGHRQPGSSFKPFILRARARGRDRPEQRLGIATEGAAVPGAKGTSCSRSPTTRTRTSVRPRCGPPRRPPTTRCSPSSGLKVKPKRVARLANDMGIRTELSTNPAMLLGGLEEGVTPLEMAYAYPTIANEGERRVGLAGAG